MRDMAGQANNELTIVAAGKYGKAKAQHIRNNWEYVISILHGALLHRIQLIQLLEGGSLSAD